MSPPRSRRRFGPSGPLRGRFTPPPDKSISHRAALFGAMCDMPVTIHNYLDSEDTSSTLDALLKIGAGVAQDAGELVVRGVGLHAALEATGGRLDVGNSGTLLRLLPGWLAGQPGGEWTLDGDESIRRRPVDRVVEPLSLMGAGVDAREGRYAPLTVRGAELQGIDYAAPVASAQVKSCVLIAGMLAAGTTTLT
ncbi:MAG: 3-phosphoshikimate 1-carboxyvinyltransferase, partial [Actinomycetota bacterium]|nr:3-phosphoshikimate 1-carboxyvinyltransferase [Actinomycetota bacterium]